MQATPQVRDGVAISLKIVRLGNSVRVCRFGRGLASHCIEKSSNRVKVEGGCHDSIFQGYGVGPSGAADFCAVGVGSSAWVRVPGFFWTSVLRAELLLWW